MKILFLVPYPLEEAPSQRFRFEQYFRILSDRNISFTVQSFLNSQNWQITYLNGNILKKTLILFSGFVKRFWILVKLNSFDFVFIHREATPVGPPIIEWIIARIFRKRIIYDFDDAIWATDKIEETKIERIVRFRNKVKWICGWAYKVSCGNEYLCAFARQFNANVVINPTTIDTQFLHNRDLYIEEKKDFITVGWTGSHSTLKYLKQIVPIIQSIEKKHTNIQFLVIANKKPTLEVKSLQFIPWSITSEIKDLLKIDIGIMPLPDDEWSKGKCGFKLLQYMSLGIPSLASPVGVNKNIITNGVNGFLCSSDEEWITALEQLLANPDVYSRIGSNGRTYVENNYSVTSNSNNFLSLFSL